MGVMSAGEKKAAFSLASIYSLRMMGLFMILPVFALYAEDLEGMTPTLIGIAVGIYGLTQAALQIPFGMLSDRFGRKPIITAGLLIFAIGSVVAAMADTMWGVIFGRALQGAGAIAAAIMALTADLTREEHRVKAMSVIGLAIGMSFAASLVLGPFVGSLIGVDGIFWLTAFLAIAAIGVLYFVVPTPVTSRFHRDAQPIPGQFKTVLVNPELLRLDVGIFILHTVLTATFVVMPLVLRDQGGLPAEEHWWIYLPVMVVAFAAMVPFVIIAESKRRMKQVFTGAIAVLVMSELLLMAESDSLIFLVVGLTLFFIAFNVLEATLPSLIVKIAPPHIKGTAMGMYSSSQFLGAFSGGLSGGWLYGQFGAEAVFLFAALMLMLWLAIAMTMRSPRYLGSFMVRVGPVDEERAHQLVIEFTSITGVAEAVVIPEDEIAYLKVDNKAVDKEVLMKYSVDYEGDDKPIVGGAKAVVS
jgi:MFS family permease